MHLSDIFRPIKWITKIIVQICYDIIKAHDGQIKAETEEVEEIELIIQLPI